MPRRAIPGETDLATTHPDLAAQLVDPTDATELTAGSKRNVGWRCSLGHEWVAIVKNRSRGSDCPFCSGRAVLAGFNDLATTHPELAAELVDPTLANELSVGSNRRVAWRCSLGHEWVASPNTRTSNAKTSSGNGCPFCSNQRILSGFNDLATTHPELAAELVDPVIATQLSSGSGKRVEWRCPDGHLWKATPNYRTSLGGGCPFCVYVVVGMTDFATTHPELAAQLVDRNVGTMYLAGSSTTTLWRCAKNHEWRTAFVTRSRGSDCPYCSGTSVLAGFNDLATTQPELAGELVNPNLATTLSAGSHQKAAWHCSLGHEWVARVSSRGLDGRGCPYCSGNAVLAGFNDIATTHPELAAELVDPTLANELSVGSNRRVAWRCDLGHEWETVVALRTKGSGCPECATTGYSPIRSGFVYLVRSPPLHAFQFGITNVPSVRLGKHSRNSFDELLELWLFESGADAAECERKLKAWKKRKKLPHVLDGDGRYDGHTETFPASAVREPFSLDRWAVPLGGKLVSLDEAEQYLGE